MRNSRSFVHLSIIQVQAYPWILDIRANENWLRASQRSFNTSLLARVDRYFQQPPSKSTEEYGRDRKARARVRETNRWVDGRIDR